MKGNQFSVLAWDAMAEGGWTPEKKLQFLGWWSEYGGTMGHAYTKYIQLGGEFEDIQKQIAINQSLEHTEKHIEDYNQVLEEEAEFKEDWRSESEQDFCFIKGTQIHMFDGSKKNIEDVKVGDEVLSMNNIKGIVTEHLIHSVNKNTMVGKVGNLIGEPHHPIFENGKWIEMKKSNNVTFEQKYVDNYYNLEIDGNNVYGSEHTYIANNQIVSGLGDSEILNDVYQRQDIFKREFV